jgi:hypothetical protein
MVNIAPIGGYPYPFTKSSARRQGLDGCPARFDVAGNREAFHGESVKTEQPATIELGKKNNFYENFRLVEHRAGIDYRYGCMDISPSAKISWIRTRIHLIFACIHAIPAM